MRIIHTLQNFNLLRTIKYCVSKTVNDKSQSITLNFTNKIYEQKEAGKPLTTGRAWKSEQLRLKSNQDLHKLWYVCVKQKNILLADKLASRHDFKARTNGQGTKIPLMPKMQLTMKRIIGVINERELIKKNYRKQLEQQYIEKKRLQLQRKVSKNTQTPQITWEMLRAKYHQLRKGVDNVQYLENMFDKQKMEQERKQKADERVEKIDKQQKFESFWQRQIEIGQRPTQYEILKNHVSNWKSLNIKHRKYILGYLNARRAKDAKAHFVQQLKVLGQQIAYEQAKNRAQGPRKTSRSQ